MVAGLPRPLDDRLAAQSGVGERLGAMNFAARKQGGDGVEDAPMGDLLSLAQGRRERRTERHLAGHKRETTPTGTTTGLAPESARTGRTVQAIPAKSAIYGKNWSGRRDSNPRPRPWHGRALPLSYTRILVRAQPVRRGLMAHAATDCNTPVALNFRGVCPSIATRHRELKSPLCYAKRWLRGSRVEWTKAWIASRFRHRFRSRPSAPSLCRAGGSPGSHGPSRWSPRR